MPFAGYRDFDDCVRRNRDKRDPKAYCAEIQRRAERNPRGTRKKKENGRTRGA